MVHFLESFDILDGDQQILTKEWKEQVEWSFPHFHKDYCVFSVIVWNSRAFPSPIIGYEAFRLLRGKERFSLDDYNKCWLTYPDQKVNIGHMREEDEAAG